MDMVALRRRPYLLVLLFVLVVFWFYSPSSRSSGPYPRTVRSPQGTFVELDELSLPHRTNKEVAPLKDIKLNVAVLEHAGFHDEVIGAFLKTLDDINVNYTVYRDGWRWGFAQVLLPFLPNLAKPIPRGAFHYHLEAGRIDVVIHTSCDIGWRDRMPDYIVKALDTTPDLHIICLQHQLESLDRVSTTQAEKAAGIAAALSDRLTYMTLSSHTTRELRRTLQKWAQEDQEVAWSTTGVETFIPIFPVDPERIEVREVSKVAITPARRSGHIPSRIAILGNVQPFRRNYQGIIDDLYDAIIADPEAWGYRTPSSATERLVALDGSHGIPPVTLHFVGSQDSDNLRIPEAVKGLVNVHSDLDYDDFYRIIATMDLIVPAFLEFVYVDLKLSSAIPAAIISRVPILGTPLLLESYAFLRPPSIILHPSGTSEIEAIRLLRRGQDPMQLVPHATPMLPSYPQWGGASGIFGSRAEWDRYHASLYDYNSDMMRSLLGKIEVQRRQNGWRVGAPIK